MALQRGATCAALADAAELIVFRSDAVGIAANINVAFGWVCR